MLYFADYRRSVHYVMEREGSQPPVVSFKDEQISTAAAAVYPSDFVWGLRWLLRTASKTLLKVIT